MQKIVIDTNVIISSVLSPSGNPAEIMRMLDNGGAQIYYCQNILDEYKKVLSYERLKIDKSTQRDIIAKVKENGVLINPPKSDVPMPDESDRIFYDTAKRAGAVLITGNMKHYPSEPFIMTPTVYLNINTGSK